MADRNFAGDVDPPGPGRTLGAVDDDDTLEATGALTDPSKSDTAKRRRRRNPVIDVRGGKMELKAYGVTEDQLESLGAVQLSVTIACSAATALLTFSIGVWQDVAFSGGADASAQGFWKGLAIGAVIGSAVLYGLGIWQFFKGRSTVGRIKKNTIHE